eukprot:5530512-Alexandrium_andersonii.AAC.1
MSTDDNSNNDYEYKYQPQHLRLSCAQRCQDLPATPHLCAGCAMDAPSDIRKYRCWIGVNDGSKHVDRALPNALLPCGTFDSSPCTRMCGAPALHASSGLRVVRKRSACFALEQDTAD